MPLLLAVSVEAGDQKIKKPLETVPSVDLEKYAGAWYEIARIPNRFQNDCVADVMAFYRLLDDGKIRVVNRCRNSDGKTDVAIGTARVIDGSSRAKLKVTFFWPFSGDYWILDLGANYEYAVVGEPDRRYLWILSRSPQMDDSLYRQILDKIAAQGYDTKLLIKTEQPDSDNSR